MGKSSDGGISDFLISGQSLLKENCHNSRTSDDIDMKLEKKKLETKQFQKYCRWRHVKHCDVIVIFPDFDQFGGIQKPDSRRIVCKAYISSNSNLLS